MATFVSSNIPGSNLDQLHQGSFFTGGTSWSADTINCALYGTTPDSALAKNDTPASRNCYNGTSGQWVVANETTNGSGSGYTAAGQALGTKTHTFGSGTFQLGAAGPSWTVFTNALGVYGCLVYDNTTTAKYAFCWNYFGGSQSVTAGTFTIVWSGSGILQYTLT